MTDLFLTPPTHNTPEPPVAPATDVPPLPTPTGTPRRFNSLRLLLICFPLITLAAAFLRFWRLGFQAYWTDEGYTLRRIQMSFTDMLNSVADQGFPPGWYALLRGWSLALEPFFGPGAFSPVGTRSLTALFGTLTVPAMYLLARQFTDRRGALLVMLLAAVNPFFIYYARDIKMYPAFWFFVVLNLALFFKWLSARHQWFWFPLFVLSGVCMTATHFMAWFIVGLQLIFLFTRPRVRPLDGALWITSVFTMGLLPLYWWINYVHPAVIMGRISTDADRGMGWITRYTDMSWETAAGLPTSHFLGYLWPVYPPSARLLDWFSLGADFPQHLDTRSWEWMANWQRYAAYIFFAILIVGLVPWRRFRRKPIDPALPVESRVTRGRWWWVVLWLALPTLALAATWIPTDSPWFDRVWQGFNPKPIWEPRYLGILVPAWLLWMGASLRRLPTVYLRTAAILFVVGASTYASLANHLIYRNTPYHITADTMERFGGEAARYSTAIAVPRASFSDVAEDAAATVARHVRPGSTEDKSYRAYSVWSTLNGEPTLRNWVLSQASQDRIKTIILTDRYGEQTAKTDILSDDALNTALGPTWTLANEQNYRWHYEWRFYFFHNWRTRVWIRAEPATKPAPPT